MSFWGTEVLDVLSSTTVTKNLLDWAKSEILRRRKEQRLLRMTFQNAMLVEQIDCCVQAAGLKAFPASQRRPAPQ
jgi:hypothetical protein